MSVTTRSRLYSKEDAAETQPDPQALFNSLIEHKSSLAGFTKMRREMLEDNTRYTELSAEIRLSRGQKKKIELDFEEQHGSIVDNIRSARELIVWTEAKLIDIALQQYKTTGTMLEVIKNTPRGSKKVRIQFRPHFLQLSLFPGV